MKMGKQRWQHQLRPARRPQARPRLLLATLALLVAGAGLPAWPPNGGGGGARRAMQASAAYLDDVAHVSLAVSRLVDQLLERASWLAELVIEAAQEEQCEALSCSAVVSSSSKPAAPPPPPAGCRLFNMGVPRADLPAEGMETCCGEHAACFATCGASKPDCDRRLQSCLKTVCRARYEWLNATSGSSKDPLQEEEDEPRLEPALDDQELPDTLDTPPPLPYPPDARRARRLRDKYKACRLAGKVLIIGNLAFGCHRFKQAQLGACCPAHLASP